MTEELNKYKPISDRVLIRPSEVSDRTSGGLLLPDLEADRILTGVVMRVGPGRIADNGTLIPMTVKEMDEIWFVKNMGYKVSLDGEEYILVRELDTLLHK